MLRAIELADRCRSADPKKTPRVGVVIARGGVIIGEAYRGEGVKADGDAKVDDDHAEVKAVTTVVNKSQIPGSTVYTTLEPCTHHDRRTTSVSCTDLLVREHVGEVVIGILDPNQAICGRGVNQLHEYGVNVQMFPLDLVMQIRLQNREFILAQQTISPKIIKPVNGETVTLEPRPHGKGYKVVDVEFECNNPPGTDVYLIVEHGGNWWPQRWGISPDANSMVWKGKVGFGDDGPHTIHIVKANALGQALIVFHRNVIERNEKRTEELRKNIRDRNADATLLDNLSSNYQAVHMNSLPKGIDSLDQVSIEVKRPEG